MLTKQLVSAPGAMAYPWETAAMAHLHARPLVNGVSQHGCLACSLTGIPGVRKMFLSKSHFLALMADLQEIRHSKDDFC